MTELKSVEGKKVVDETNEVTEEIVPNLFEQNKEAEEVNQSEGPEQDFASIVSSFLISKVSTGVNQLKRILM
jgi:hypothetical protein